MDSELKGMRGAEIRQNGDGIEHGIDGYHAEEAYPRGEHGRASLSSDPRGKMGTMRAAEGVLSS